MKHLLKLNLFVLILMLITTVGFSQHFTTIYTGNPYLPMNFIVMEATIDGENLEAGDEIAVFDIGDDGASICVGTVVLTGSITPGSPLTFAAGTDEAGGIIDGFTPGHEIIFRFWDNSASTEITLITPAFSSAPGFVDVYTLSETAILESLTNASYTQELNFGQGYTWFSVNVNPGSMVPNALFGELTPCSNDRLIAQTSFALYTGTSWVGSLTSLGMDKMYCMKLCTAQNQSIVGEAAALDPINLLAGYTWLGYKPQQCQTVNSAMAGLSPGPSYNDRIIGQSSFALYSGSTWVGSLTQMCPGIGYIIKMANPQTLTYTASMVRNSVGAPNEAFTLESPTGIYPETNQQYSMMVLAQLRVSDDRLSLNEKDVVYAYIDGEVRGMANPMPDLDGAIFLTVTDNDELAKPVSFMVWMDEQQKLLPLKESLSFEPLAAVGELNSPFILTLDEDANLLGLNANSMNEIAITVNPNPSKGKFTISIVGAQNDIALTILNTNGQTILTKHLINTNEQYRFNLDIKNQPKGIYYLKFVSNNAVVVRKMIIQ